MKRISDYMQRVLIEVPLFATAAEAARRMEASNVGAVVVMDGEEFHGVLTERDLSRRIVGQGWRPDAAVVSLLSPQRVPQVSPDSDVRSVAEAMRAAGTRYAIVVDPLHPNRPVGIAAMQDLLRAAMGQCEEDQTALRNYISGGTYA